MKLSIAIAFLITVALCAQCFAAEETVTSFSFSTGGMSRYECSSFSVYEEDGEVILSVNYVNENGETDFTRPVNKALLAEAAALVKRHSLETWDGFNGKPFFDVSDGDSFALNVKFTSGRRIRASGYVKTPDGYRSFRSDFLKFRDSVIKRYGPAKN